MNAPCGHSACKIISKLMHDYKCMCMYRYVFYVSTTNEIDICFNMINILP